MLHKPDFGNTSPPAWVEFDAMKVLVTGASGFVGSALVRHFLSQSWQVTALVRQASSTPAMPGLQHHAIFGIERLGNVAVALQGQDVVVHCAARVHVMNDKSGDPLAAFRAVNVQGTLSLARLAAANGVQRFVFISSVGVNGSQTIRQAFTAEDEVAPHSPYAVSKSEAEIGLRAIARSTGMAVVIVRPPLVYGPSAPGNFGRLVRWLQRGMPLPFGAIHNQRSLLAVDNLVDLIASCMTHVAAVNQTFLVSDGEDISTTELLRRLSALMGRQARLLPMPVKWLELVASISGKTDLAQSLCGSLQIDLSKTRRLLDWSPPLTLDQGLKKAVTGRACETNF